MSDSNSDENKNVIALDDIHLAQKAQRDRKTAELVLRRLQPKIFQVIRACVRSSPHAEEIGQNVALEVLKSLHTYRGEAPLEAWAGGVTYRVCMKTLKKEREWDLVHTPMEDTTLSSAATPEKKASKQQLFNSLLNKLEHLPNKRKTTLVLHLVHGYTVKEISEMLSVSPNTTKDRLKTGLRELRQIFDQSPALRQAMLEEIR